MRIHRLLSKSLTSPFVGDGQPQIPDYKLPDCYHVQRTVFKPSHIPKFVVETLFYIFYNMPFDRWQSLAAQELVHKNWKFWEERNKWVIETKNLDEETKKKITFALPDWVTFEPLKWEYAKIEGLDPAKLLSNFTSESLPAAAQDTPGA